MKRSSLFAAILIALGLVFATSGCTSTPPRQAAYGPPTYALVVSVNGGQPPTAAQWDALNRRFRLMLAARGLTLVSSAALADKLVHVQFFPDEDDPTMGNAYVVGVKNNPGAQVYASATTMPVGYGFSSSPWLTTAPGYGGYYSDYYNAYSYLDYGGYYSPPPPPGSRPPHRPPGHDKDPNRPPPQYSSDQPRPRPPSDDHERSPRPYRPHSEPTYSYSSSSPSPSYSPSGYSSSRNPVPTSSSLSMGSSSSYSSSSSSYSSSSSSYSSSSSSSYSAPSPSYSDSSSSSSSSSYSPPASSSSSSSGADNTSRIQPN